MDEERERERWHSRKIPQDELNFMAIVCPSKRARHSLSRDVLTLSKSGAAILRSRGNLATLEHLKEKIMTTKSAVCLAFNVQDLVK